MLNIESITIDEARQIAALFGQSAQSENPYCIGGKYFIRTVTHHHTGRLVQVTSQELVLEDAAWIADDGRLQPALESGVFNEVEMFPKGSRVIVGRAAIVDAVEIGSIPMEQK